jgi:glycosyltransferase involved in cell wall biosynthesis
MRTSVVIPTFKRPDSLGRCLQALAQQTILPDEVLVVVRDSDTETRTYVDGLAPLGFALVRVPVQEAGVIAAMNKGIQAATGEIICLLDDDTAPFPDWLERIKGTFATDPKIGGVGGRDFQATQPGEAELVGVVQWQGRIIGNHHWGIGPARPVDLLKGANCAYRAEPLRAIGFDVRLTGGGAQVNWELGLGLALRRAGWTLIYDPAIAVDHFTEPRFEGDTTHRGEFNPQGIVNAVHNETLFLWEHFNPARRAVFVSWALLVGTRHTPGLGLTAYNLLKRDRTTVARMKATIKGRLTGIQTARTTHQKFDKTVLPQ